MNIKDFFIHGWDLIYNILSYDEGTSRVNDILNCSHIWLSGNRMLAMLPFSVQWKNSSSRCLVFTATSMLYHVHSYIYIFPNFFLFIFVVMRCRFLKSLKFSFQNHQGENVIFISNHQSEADPAVIALLLETTNPHISESIVSLL